MGNILNLEGRISYCILKMIPNKIETATVFLLTEIIFIQLVLKFPLRLIEEKVR